MLLGSDVCRELLALPSWTEGPVVVFARNLLANQLRPSGTSAPFHRWALGYFLRLAIPNPRKGA